MKRLLLLSFIFSAFLLNAQNVIQVNADITGNTTWESKNIYVLTGASFIYVKNDAVLTIEAGTIIKGDPAALVITRGSKIIADGKAEIPIVFTSNKPAGQRAPGDWGGLLILGKAKVNCPGGECNVEGGLDPVLGKYGGQDDADNSGILRYVRVEFAGIAFQPNNETNSLTLGGVGSGTTIDHVQTSFGGDDAF
ncbi:MAG TPA: T9SS C-terminal target domain-containing protein, partial [Saprospiraceae bacterium]|nr:T9SS C-terminal target domain-containing protein [Saprospiraceae bacterium]